MVRLRLFLSKSGNFLICASCANFEVLGWMRLWFIILFLVELSLDALFDHFPLLATAFPEFSGFSFFVLFDCFESESSLCFELSWLIRF